MDKSKAGVQFTLQVEDGKHTADHGADKTTWGAEIRRNIML